MKALIVGRRAFGEAHLVVRLLSDEGCYSVLAPHGRKSTRRFGGALELFTSVEAELQAKRKEGIQVAERFEVIRLRLGLSQDLERLSLAAYWAELAGRIAPEGLTTSLRGHLEQALDQAIEVGASVALRRRFELQCLEVLGLQPELDGCVRCGERGRFLDFRQGGLLCEAHRASAKEIGPKTLMFLKGQEELQFHEAERAARAVAAPLDAMVDSLLASPLASRDALGPLGL